MAQKTGFTDPRELKRSPPIEVKDPRLIELVGNATFWSITYRLFKVKGLEDRCEDYGQVAVYKGTLPEHKHSYQLDDHHTFITRKPMLVCGNSAAMVGDSWLSKHFHIMGDRGIHFGLFGACGPASPGPAQSVVSESSAPSPTKKQKTETGSVPAGACGPGG